MTKPLRVLLVEDETLILMQLEDLVEEAGHLVVGTAMRSAEAVSLAHEVRPDLAFVDINLCDGDSGLDVAQALNQIEGLMVIFVTANPLRLGEDIAGAAGVISKPFTRTILFAGLSYLEQCIRCPPPTHLLPKGMRMSERFLA